MNANPTADLQSALEKYEADMAKIRWTVQLIESSANRLGQLQACADLAAQGTLDEVTRLLAVAAVGPSQIPRLSAETRQAEKTMLAACNEFLKTRMAPHFGDLEKRALAKLEPGLKPMFADANLLRAAALGSDSMRLLYRVRQKWTESFACFEGSRKARCLLTAFAELAEFEQKYLQ